MIVRKTYFLMTITVTKDVVKTILRQESSL